MLGRKNKPKPNIARFALRSMDQMEKNYADSWRNVPHDDFSPFRIDGRNIVQESENWIKSSLEFCTFRSSLWPILQGVGGFFACVHPERGR